jgi:hypothetical protein
LQFLVDPHACKYSVHNNNIVCTQL